MRETSQYDPPFKIVQFSYNRLPRVLLTYTLAVCIMAAVMGEPSLSVNWTPALTHGLVCVYHNSVADNRTFTAPVDVCVCPGMVLEVDFRPSVTSRFVDPSDSVVNLKV